MNKIAVVTGASGGIGKATAIGLARNGYTVYANARNEEKLTGMLNASAELDIRPLIFDIRDLDSVREAVESIGKIDCLVNNAGASMAKKDIADVTENDWDTIIDTNAKGYFFITKYSIKSMEAGACIVNISSGAAKTGGDLVSIPYCASKGAINSLTIACARELAKRGIRVNAVSPGFVDTAMLELNGQPKKYYDMVIPLGRLGMPDDIANMVIFLASDKANFITGQIIEVNGGDIMG